MRWPKKNDNPFFVKEPNSFSSTWACLNWFESLGVDDSYLADAFKESADKIISELSNAKTRQHGEKFFLPIAFLYRHCAELLLKQIIRRGINLDFIKKETVQSSLGKHNLHELWNHAKTIIVHYWPDESAEDLQAFEAILLKFHNMDKTGQELRYSKDTKGKSTFKSLPNSVDLEHFKDTFDAVYNFLDSCLMGLNEAWESQCEMMNDSLDAF